MNNDNKGVVNGAFEVFLGCGGGGGWLVIFFDIIKLTVQITRNSTLIRYNNVCIIKDIIPNHNRGGKSGIIKKSGLYLMS